MKQTFLHRFKDGRAASQAYEVDPKTRTYRFVGWEFSDPDVIDPLPVGECQRWFKEVERHFAEIGLKPSP
jgi:hypothetical protein